MNVERPTDRDSFKFKRVEVPGALMFNLFRTYYSAHADNVRLKLDKERGLGKAVTKAAVAEVSRVSKNTAEHARKKNTVSANARKSASEEREKRKNPRRQTPALLATNSQLLTGRRSWRTPW
jgi:DNA-directed RNA polymerase beta subunit